MNFGKITSKFNDPRPGLIPNTHQGIDVDNGYGSVVNAPISGDVFFSGPTYAYLYRDGKLVKVKDYTVELKGDDGFYWTFSHLQLDGLAPIGRVGKNSQIGYQTSHVHIGKFKGWAGSITQSELKGLSRDPVGPQGGDPDVGTNLGDVIFQIRKEMENIETTEGEKVAFAQLFEDPLEVIRHFLRAGKAKTADQYVYQIRLQDNQLGEAQTLLRERTAEVEELKKKLKEVSER